jgi:hypothetical protein
MLPGLRVLRGLLAQLLRCLFFAQFLLIVCFSSACFLFTSASKMGFPEEGLTEVLSAWLPVDHCAEPSLPHPPFGAEFELDGRQQGVFTPPQAVRLYTRLDIRCRVPHLCQAFFC